MDYTQLNIIFAQHLSSFQTMMKKLFPILSLLLFASSCHRNDFCIQGHVKDGEGKTLYFEAVQLSRTVLLDSTQLPADGAFSFHAPRTPYPEFYRLRLNNSYIHLAVDSTETIAIEIPGLPIAADYRISGSDESEKIRHISEAGNTLKAAIGKASLQKNLLPDHQRKMIEGLQNEVRRYKETVIPYITEDPSSPAAYFAIFQQVNGLDIFDRTNREDNRYILTVANAYNTFLPESPRTQHLYRLALSIIQNERNAKQAKEEEAKIPAATEVSLIDIALPDLHGRERRLSDLKGKVVLLDFSAYEGKYSPDYNRALGQLYEKYHRQGLEIYQVSIDPNENLWQVSADNLPWICVRDADTTRSRVVLSYNVRSLPTAFLIDRNNVLQQRVTKLSELPREIEKLLKQK